MNKFPFKVIPKHQRKFRALIIDVRDSLIIFRQFKRSKGSKKLIRDERRKFETCKITTQHQLDSLSIEVEKAVNEIIYSEERVMSISSIKKLKHSNSYIPKKAKQLNVIGLGGLGLGFALLPLVGLTGSNVPGIAAFGIWVGEIVYMLIAQTQRLNLQKIWKINRVIRS